MRWVFCIVVLLTANLASAQTTKKSNLTAYLKKKEACEIAVGVIDPSNRGTDSDPNIRKGIWCIADISRGKGVDKVEGCAFVTFDSSEETYSSLSPACRDKLFIKDKSCDWSTIQTLLQTDTRCFYGGAIGKTAGDVIKYRYYEKLPPQLLHSTVKEFDNWLLQGGK